MSLYIPIYKEMRLAYVLLALVSMVSANEVYTRSYLQNMKRAKEEADDMKFISEGVKEVEKYVLQAATDGLTHINLPPANCNEAREFRVSLERCESIIKEIKEVIIKKFPDSDISYNKNTNVYTVQWD